jgi:hypothetical protein
MGLGPVPASFQAPAIDDVADEIKIFRFVPAQEIQQLVGLTAACA